MKNVFFIIVLLCAGFSVTSCTPEEIVDQVEELATEGEDGEIQNEEKGGGNS